MYKDASLRRFQYYVNPDWVGGVYASPSIAGSRCAHCVSVLSIGP